MENEDANAQPGRPENPKAQDAFSSNSGVNESAEARPISYWLKKFFACNPFYLVSAATLLYGLYLVSTDASFLTREIWQLGFNFGALQLYELLVVTTAIVLARRRIWYDSVLLVGLENLLVLVPFILISQAALLDRRLIWIICLACGGAVMARYYGLKHFLRELNLPRTLLGWGLMVLCINVALPLIFRHLNDSKIGTKPTDGAAYEMNCYSWWLLLPALFALVNALPRPRQTGELLPQRRWLPMGLFTLWCCGTGVHLYSLGYVFNFDWEPLFAIPLAWVMTWSLYLRHGDFLDRPARGISQSLLALPALSTLAALEYGGNVIFLALTGCNVLGYALKLMQERSNRAALHWLIISIAALLAGVVKTQPIGLPVTMGQEGVFGLCAAVYVLYWVLRSRNPKAGLFGAMLVVVVPGWLMTGQHVWELSAQGAMTFLLLHSLFWKDEEHPGAFGCRIIVGIMCATYSFVMAQSGWLHALPVVYGTGAVLVAASMAMKILNGSWRPITVPLAGMLMLFAQPGDFMAAKIQAAPTPLLVVIGSFLLFGAGTLAALTKSRWNRPVEVTVSQSSKSNTLIL